MTLDQLREWLEARGFHTSRNGLQGQYNECDWYAYRKSKIAARECECNEGKPAQIVVKPYSHVISGIRHESVEINLTAQAGVWWNLNAYSIKPEEVPALLDQIEMNLVSAWNVITPTTSPDEKKD